MIVADILMWFLLIAGTYIVINGYWMTTQGLFPDFVDFKRIAVGQGDANGLWLRGGGSLVLRVDNPAQLPGQKANEEEPDEKLRSHCDAIANR